MLNFHDSHNSSSMQVRNYSSSPNNNSSEYGEEEEPLQGYETVFDYLEAGHMVEQRRKEHVGVCQSEFNNLETKLAQTPGISPSLASRIMIDVRSRLRNMLQMIHIDTAASLEGDDDRRQEVTAVLNGYKQIFEEPMEGTIVGQHSLHQLQPIKKEWDSFSVSSTSSVRSVSHTESEHSYASTSTLPNPSSLTAHRTMMTRSKQKEKERMVAAGRISKVKKEEGSSTGRRSITPWVGGGGNGEDLFAGINTKEIFTRSVDGKNLWAAMEGRPRTDIAFLSDVKDADTKKRCKLFVRILGYHLMDIERRLGRLITAGERREFMDRVASSLPIDVKKDCYVNTSSKGTLDQFIRNKRHYQARKYGISLSTQAKK